MPLGYQTGTGSRGAGAAGAGGSDGGSSSTISRTPNRSWNRRSGAGAHQFASPARRMNAGTSVAADERRVHQHREGEADAEQLDEADARRGEGEEHDREQRGGRGDDAAGALEPDGDRLVVVAGAVVLLLDAGQQEHLVVHRQAEGDAEHQDRRGRVEGAGRREVEEPGEVALLEDPHHRPEGRGEADSRLSTSALTGTSRLPNIMNSRTNVATAMMRPATAAGRRATPSCRRAGPPIHRRAGRTARRRRGCRGRALRPRVTPARRRHDAEPRAACAREPLRRCRRAARSADRRRSCRSRRRRGRRRRAARA